MKRTKLLLIFLLLCGIATNAQETPDTAKENKTKLEAFQARTGVVIVRGFSTIGSAQGLYGSRIIVEAKEFTDASSGRKEYGITIQVKEAGRLEKENTSYIDYDEVESLIKGIDYISKIDSTVTKLGEFQADYRTKGDLTISTFSNRGEIMVAVSSGRIGRASAYYSLSNLGEIRTLIVNAKTKLDSIRPVTTR